MTSPTRIFSPLLSFLKSAFGGSKMAPPAPASFDHTEKMMDGICEALDSIEAAGTFAAIGKIDNSNIKPFNVRDVGLVSFPLQEPLAHQLIEKARQAPYGKGSETFVDTSVRNTWELDAAQLDLSDDGWIKTIEGGCNWVAQKLGITAPVKAELYRMLIYEKGAMFKAHTDTEKIPGMFGTLVICLPSEHQGGDLVLKHRHATKVFKSSEVQPSMLCWFSDVSHEVLPVTSGYRWVLTFNLAISEPNPQNHPSAALNAPGYSKLRSALETWLKSCQAEQEDILPAHLYYLLDHTYTETNISLNGLKGADLPRMRCLKDVCEELNATLLFAVLQKEEFGECEADWDDYGRDRWRDPYDDGDDDDEDDEDEDEDEYVEKDSDDDDEEEGDDDGEWHKFEEVHETNVFIKKLVCADGRTLRANMDIGMEDLEENLVQKCNNPFKSATRGEKDYSGFTGNEGVSATHWYRKTVAIMVPNDAMDMFLTQSVTRDEAQNLVPQYLAKCADPKTYESAMKMVHHLARLSWAVDNFGSYNYNYTDQKFSPAIAAEFLETILLHRQYELFNKAIGWFKTRLGTKPFDLVRRAAADDSFEFSRIKESLLHNLARNPVNDYMQLLTALVPLSDAACNPRLRDWVANEAVPSATKACQAATVTSAAGSAIVTIVKEYRDLEYFKTDVIPVIEKQASLMPFALAAVLQFLYFTAEDNFDKTLGLELSKPLLKSIINVMDCASIRTEEGTVGRSHVSKIQRYDYLQAQAAAVARATAREHANRFLDPSFLAECFARCIQFGWDDLSMILCFKIVSKVDTIPPTEFHPFWIPMLRELIITLDANKVPLSTSRYRELACAIFEAYLDGHVGQEPKGEVNYRLNPVNCTCRDCTLLNAFLTSNERSWRFPAGKGRRQHIHQKLEYAQLDCTHVTERSGSPQTLIVTKGLDPGTRAKNEWNDRFAQAWDDIITKFDQQKLKELLGGEFEKITTMCHLRLPGSRGPPVMSSKRAGSKRKAGEY
ncbi:hypothetical protein QBC35DRAFT_504643 [Podospora australis]|uniref:Fe2OG dioxygenase domain-containing protein n=1 Tax=Podospora australis TaxID=1536484 RepID=A0AAN7ADZ8_9PEZI|nr:hypothetical protein QBC35DRAFT_504643 [Podospora australis]